MKLKNHRLLFFFSIIVLLLLPGKAHGQNDKSPDERQILQTIYSEVRLLRLTLQKSSVSSIRLQVMTERLRIQTERVRELARALEDIKNRVVELQTETALFTKRAKELEAVIQREGNSSLRAQEEDELKAIQLGLENQKIREQKLNDREVQAEQKLNIEQAKLDELNEQLEKKLVEIENELGRGGDERNKQ